MGRSLLLPAFSDSVQVAYFGYVILHKGLNMNISTFFFSFTISHQEFVSLDGWIGWVGLIIG